MSSNEADERLNRALAASLRQEIQAPATAITDFLAIIIEDARALKLDHMLDDLDHMRVAGARLNAFVSSIVDGGSSGRADGGSEALYRGLRHDLRTPLNAIIGYSELLLEDMEGGDHPLRGDLEKLKDSAHSLVGQIDSIVALAGSEPKLPGGDGARAAQFGIVADVLRTVRPLEERALPEGARSSAILVVDDNASNRDVLARRLERAGHRVTTAADGAAALALAQANDFDLILLDLIMPELSGYEVLSRLKAAAETRHVPVIVISALDELDTVVRCIEAGAEDYLTKPFDPVLLGARINASLERKWLRDRERQFVAELEREKRRSETLLLNILPASIVERMRAGETAIADRIAESTVLFCDLVGFTTLSQDMPPDRLIDFLSRVFVTFDGLAAEEGVEKIKTIGDCYMAAAGVPEPQPDHALRVTTLARRMMQAVRELSDTTGLSLQARIGIHSGPIVAGVIGAHKFIYDVWGDTVNTASRMESHSVSGRIHLSAATRHLLDGRFALEPRGTVEIRGKGPMETYFLAEE